MTRINAGIDPRSLCDQHLLAEHREMKRIPNCVSSGRANLDNVPDSFRLGPGHVSFFYDKLGYLETRYKAVRDECLDRGFNISDYSEAWDHVPDGLFRGWEPSVEDRRLVQERIEARLGTMKTKPSWSRSRKETRSEQ